MRAVLYRLATLFGLGLKVPAPGTWGTLAAVPFAVLAANFGVYAYMGICVVLLIVAIVSCEIYEQDTKSHDNSEVIIDEVIGYFVAVTFLPLTWQSFAAGFVLFRIFDITKPLLIGLIDRRMKGGVGTVADDVAAGLVVNIILQYVATHTVYLG